MREGVDRRLGKTLGGRFQLQRDAGRGGMSEVFRARDLEMERDVALKLLTPPSGGADSAEDTTEWTKRFDREIRALSALSHPRIVGYVAHGVAGEDRWLAMEWLDGETLHARLKRAPLSVSETFAVAKGAAEALAYAHAHGVVHRDVKPGNLFLVGGSTDDVRLLDFGIARLTKLLVEITRTATLVGTPGYMSPEQIRGGQIGASADVFSLGCVLYRCLTGRVPFPGEDALAVIARTLFERAPPPSSLAPSITPEIDELVLRMIDKDPAARPRDGAEVLFELEAAERAGLLDHRAHAAPIIGLEEQRVASVLLGSARVGRDEPTVRLAAALEPDGATVDDLVQSFGVKLEWLPDGAFCILATGAGNASDQAVRVAKCALALHRAWTGPIVVATGRTVTSTALVGEVIDRAAAMLHRARTQPEGGVWIDSMTAELLPPRFEVQRSGEMTSLIGEVTLRRDHLLEEPVPTFLGKTTPCVGRDVEIDILGASFARCAEEPAAACVVVTAPAGHGKSRLLVEWLVRLRAERRDAQVWRAQATVTGGAFAMVGQMLRGLGGVEIGEPAESAQAKVLALASRNFEGSEQRRVGEFLGEMAGVHFPAEPGTHLYYARQDGQRMSDQTLAAWLDFVEGELRQQPLLIVLEDLQWADGPTVRLCDAALRVCSEQPLMVLALARPDVHETFPQLFEERNAQWISLAPLGKRACETFVREVLPTCTDAALSKIVEEAQGSALLLEELVRAEAEGRGGQAPESVLAILGARLEDLPEPSRRVLRAASIFGVRFWAGGVSALVGGTETPLAFESLVERDVIVARTATRFSGEKEYAFRHPLVREAAYRMLVDADRELGHKLAGEWLEKQKEPDALVIAQHFETGRDRERALTWFRRAAEQAFEGNAFDAAIERAERAIVCGAEGETLGRLRLLQANAHGWRGASVERLQCAERAVADLAEDGEPFFQALAALGMGYEQVGDTQSVERVAQRLLSARPTQDAGVAERGRCAARLAIGVLHRTGRVGLADALLSVAEDALSKVPGDRALAARLHEAHGSEAKFHGELGRFLIERRAARDAWSDLGETRQVATALVNEGDAWMNLGLYADAERALRRAIAEAERAGLQQVAVFARHNLGFALARQGLLAEARLLGEASVSAFERLGNRFMTGHARVYFAATLRRLGEVAASEQQARIALANPYSPGVGAYAAAALAQVLLLRGEVREALATSTEGMKTLAVGMAEGEGDLRLVHAEALLASGDVEGARQSVRVARARILEVAAKLDDPKLRASYTDNIDEHARTLALARELAIE